MILKLPLHSPLSYIYYHSVSFVEKRITMLVCPLRMLQGAACVIICWSQQR